MARHYDRLILFASSRFPLRNYFINGNYAILALAESIFLAAATVTPPAPAKSLFFASAS
jgi:hypothetical protein